MNYFELYPGDYMRDTAELRLAEHGAFLKLLMTYYAKEKPLPASYESLYTIAVAMNASEKEAVRKVADEFFPVAADGFRHSVRVDEEIEKAQGRIDAARQNGRKGGRPKQNPLGSKNETQQKPNGLDLGSATETQTVTQEKAPHTPHATRQSTYVEEQPDTPAAPAVSGQFETHHDPKPAQANPAGHAAAALNRAGCKVTSQNPNLIAATAAGVTTEHLLEVVNLNPGKPAGYVIAIARREHVERAAPVTTGVNHAQPPKESLVQRAQRKAIAAGLEAERTERQDDDRTLVSDDGALRPQMVHVVR